MSGPDEEICLEIGSIGVCLFTLTFILSIHSYNIAKNRYAVRIFICSGICCLFELPRYLALIIQRNYTSKYTYVSHLIGSIFFFLCFSFVCYLLNDAVDLSNSASKYTSMFQRERPMIQRLIFNRKFLTIINICMMIFVVITIIDCSLYDSLSDFFSNSKTYLAFTFFDGTMNVMLAVTLGYYGYRLHIRMIRFSKSTVNVVYPVDAYSEKIMLIRMNEAISRLLYVMSLCLICFLSRTTMLMIKATVVELNQVNIPNLPTYGLLWWTLADFVPRCVPLVVFNNFFSGPKKKHTKYNVQTGSIVTSSNDTPASSHEINQLINNNRSSQDDYDLIRINFSDEILQRKKSIVSHLLQTRQTSDREEAMDYQSSQGHLTEDGVQTDDDNQSIDHSNTFFSSFWPQLDYSSIPLYQPNQSRPFRGGSVDNQSDVSNHSDLISRNLVQNSNGILISFANQLPSSLPSRTSSMTTTSYHILEGLNNNNELVDVYDISNDSESTNSQNYKKPQSRSLKVADSK